MPTRKGSDSNLRGGERSLQRSSSWIPLKCRKEEFASIPQYSYATGIRDYDDVTFDEQEDDSAIEKKVEDQEVASAADKQAESQKDAPMVEVEDEGTPEDGSWFAKRLGWMASFF